MVSSKKEKPILICQLMENSAIVESDEVTITRNVLTCLNETTQGNFALIMICFSTRLVFINNDVIELCRCLKNNPLTREKPVFALADIPHLGVAVQMREAEVDFMEIRRADKAVEPKYLMGLVLKDDGSIRMDRVLARMCPFLSYIPVDERCELITCRAYRNRLVLGGRRLHEICETADHSHCEYFINPRIKT